VQSAVTRQARTSQRHAGWQYELVNGESDEAPTLIARACAKAGDKTSSRAEASFQMLPLPPLVCSQVWSLGVAVGYLGCLALPCRRPFPKSLSSAAVTPCKCKSCSAHCLRQVGALGAREGAALSHLLYCSVNCEVTPRAGHS